MLMMPKTVSTPIRSSSFSRALATVIFTQKLPDNRVEQLGLLRVAQMPRVRNRRQPRALGDIPPQWSDRVLHAPDQQRRHAQISQNLTRVRLGERDRGKLVPRGP